MEGPLYGEILAFTGALGMTRQKAADMAAQAGCDVAGNVSKNVTLLVVGVQDKTRLKGYEKSAKHRQAEELILKGQDIQILSERESLQEKGGTMISDDKESAPRTPRDKHVLSCLSTGISAWKWSPAANVNVGYWIEILKGER